MGRDHRAAEEVGMGAAALAPSRDQRQLHIGELPGEILDADPVIV
jgi:hypothetical protein